jgi:F-box protein 11
MATKRIPAAFLSYVRLVDAYDRGRLSEFRERLSTEVQIQTGKEFPIFQDRTDIKWGQQWRERIDESLDSVTFLIPIVTPGFFESDACRDELEKFIERERSLDSNDLILPVYYVDCPLVNDGERRKTDRLAEIIANRQYADWRDLRFEPLSTPQVGKALAGMAVQIRDALERSAPRPKAARTGATGARGTGRNGKASAAGKASQEAPESGEAARKAEMDDPRERKGPVGKSEVATHVVDAMHRADFATITEALEAASSGDRVLVQPGLYEEGLVIDKPVEIIGDGEHGEVVIRATGQACVLFQARMGRLTNLVLEQMGGGNWSGVDIARGRLDLEDCDITSASLSCIAVHQRADPRIRRNRIHDGKAGGVFVYEDGLGTFEDNEIFGNALSGVSIKEGGNPTLRRNRIHDGKQGGVFVFNNGLGTLEDNEIFGNAFAGVEIKEGGNPTLRRNVIKNNGYEAIWIHKNGGGTFEDNDLRDNGRGPWDISEDSEANVKRSGNKE